jgi:hypothetical protein
MELLEKFSGKYIYFDYSAPGADFSKTFFT